MNKTNFSRLHYSLSRSIIVNGKWNDFNYILDNKLLTIHHITDAVKLFQETISPYLEDRQLMKVQFKVQEESGNYKSISYIQTIDKSQFDDLSTIFITFWNNRDQHYYLTVMKLISFTFQIIPLNSEIKQSKLIQPRTITELESPTFKFHGFNLPSTMDFTKWDFVDHITLFNDGHSAIIYKIDSNLKRGEVYHIELFDTHILVQLKVNNKIILEFTDHMRDVENLSSFTRIIKNQEYIFENGILVLKKIKRLTSFLSTQPKSPFKSDKFITMDLETRTLNGVMSPYCVSIYDGKTTTSFYLSDFENINIMMESAITSIMIRKYHYYKVYIHNFSNFDGIFLLNVLSHLSDQIEPIIRDNKFIELRFHYGKDELGKYKYTLYFRDSLLLLPSSLAKLAKAFDIEDRKGIFPYAFVNNPNIPLNYNGPIAEFK